MIIQNQDFLKIRFQMVQFTKNRVIAMVPSILNLDVFVQISNGF